MRSLLILLTFLCSCAHGASTQTNGKTKIEYIHFDGEVNEESVSRTIDAIHLANDLKFDALVIEINSPGGYNEDGFHLAKAIEQSQTPVTCIVDGMAASMAFYILQACDTRVMTKRSQLMTHETVLMFPNGTRIDESSAAIILTRLIHDNRNLAEFEAARMKMPVDEYLERIHNKEWIMSWEEAIKFHAIDLVIDSIKDLGL